MALENAIRSHFLNVEFDEKRSSLRKIYMKYSLFLSLLISFAAHAQVAELKSEEILKLLPSEIDGYKVTDEFKTRHIKIGTLTYTLCEKKFRKKDKYITLLLFDFAHAEIMYKQSMSTWNKVRPVESDSVVLRSVAFANCEGWESYLRHTNQSQIFIGICGRFFMNMTGDKVGLEDLKAVLDRVPIDQFPR